MEEFLSGYTSYNTKRAYRHDIELFSRWYEKPISEILKERKADLTPRNTENNKKN